ncbi:MAG: HEAT repeat domain-containing protein [Treponema sp.]|jgi:HEAT repeat protein|nr:HEAT repeat domain-containing protein [Treponema sp.]
MKILKQYPFWYTSLQKQGIHGRLYDKKEKRMMVKYRFSALIIAALIAIPAAYGQTKSSEDVSVEESYLQEAVDLMIVRETSKQDSLDQKLIALAFIGSLLEQGSTSDEIRITLERLSLEGTNVQAREKGRLKNDYPEVRRQAVRHLATVGTDEARAALVKVCVTDNEPMVLQEAVRSLGIIGTDKDGEVVAAIVWVTNKYANTISPDNLLALAAIDSLEKIAKNSKGVREDAFQLLIKISDGSFAPPVKEKARQTVMDMRNLIANSAKEQKNQQSGGQPK